VVVSPSLSWTPGAGADSRDVYFGTNPTPGGGELQGNQAGTTFDPGTLATSTTYYWRIDEVNAQGTTTGTVSAPRRSTMAPSPTTATTKPTEPQRRIRV